MKSKEQNKQNKNRNKLIILQQENVNYGKAI